MTMKRRIVVAAVAVAAIWFVTGLVIGKAYGASQVRGAPYVTATQAEDSLYASTWATNNQIEDTACEGFGDYKQASTPGSPRLYKSFGCAATYSDVSDQDEPMTCTFLVTVRTLPTAGIKIVGGSKPARCEIDPLVGQWTGTG